MENNVIDIVPTDENNRYCWVCFATDEEDELMAWVIVFIIYKTVSIILQLLAF